MRTTRLVVVLLSGLCAALWWADISGAAPLGTEFTYQGRLLDGDQEASNLYDFRFRIYDALTMGTQTGSDVIVADVNVTDGYFTVELDFGSSIFTGEAQWLEIGVRPGTLNDPSPYTALSPRQKITPTPYSQQTRGIRVDGVGNVGVGTLSPVCNLDVVGSDNSIALARINQKGQRAYSGFRLDRDGSEKWLMGMSNTDEKLIFRRTASTNDMVIDTDGNVGIGTTSPWARLSVGGPGYVGIGVYGTASTFGVYGESFGYAIYGRTTSGTAVYGTNDNAGNEGMLGTGDYGVRGNHGSSGNWGYIANSDHGVFGEHAYSGNYGYLGDSFCGVYGENASSGNTGGIGLTNCGVLGNNYYDYGMGIYGSSSGTIGGIGVKGYNSTSQTSGELGNDSSGVYGYYPTGNYGELGTDSYGVYGKNTTSGNYGYLGSSDFGVYGASDNGGDGVYGFSNGGVGVYGSCSGVGLAGYFQGSVYVTSNVSAQSFTDRTPYPKDLATAYDAVMSLERLPDGQYEENNKENQLDHSKLSDFVRAKDGTRDLSATVSCQNEVIKDLIRQNKELTKRLEAMEQKSAERIVK